MIDNTSWDGRAGGAGAWGLPWMPVQNVRRMSWNSAKSVVRIFCVRCRITGLPVALVGGTGVFASALTSAVIMSKRLGGGVLWSSISRLWLGGTGEDAKERGRL